MVAHTILMHTWEIYNSVFSVLYSSSYLPHLLPSIKACIDAHPLYLSNVNMFLSESLIELHLCNLSSSGCNLVHPTLCHVMYRSSSILGVWPLASPFVAYSFVFQRGNQWKGLLTYFISSSVSHHYHRCSLYEWRSISPVILYAVTSFYCETYRLDHLHFPLTLCIVLVSIHCDSESPTSTNKPSATSKLSR